MNMAHLWREILVVLAGLSLLIVNVNGEKAVPAKLAKRNAEPGRQNEKYFQEAVVDQENCGKESSKVWIVFDDRIVAISEVKLPFRAGKTTQVPSFTNPRSIHLLICVHLICFISYYCNNEYNDFVQYKIMVYCVIHLAMWSVTSHER